MSTTFGTQQTITEQNSETHNEQGETLRAAMMADKFAYLGQSKIDDSKAKSLQKACEEIGPAIDEWSKIRAQKIKAYNQAREAELKAAAAAEQALQELEAITKECK